MESRVASGEVCSSASDAGSDWTPSSTFRHDACIHDDSAFNVVAAVAACLF